MDLAKISGASELQAWFGSWPSFHDAEILELHLDRQGLSILRVHAWKLEYSKDKSELLSTRHFVARFVFDEITNLELDGFNHQNVIDGFSFKEIDGEIHVEIQHCWGLSGFIQARHLRIEFEPGSPE